jgi:outer membrane protein TolC
MRRLSLLAMAFALAVPFAPDTARTQSLPVVRVGFVIDGPWEGNDRTRRLFEREIRDIAEGEWDVRFPEDKRVVCDWSGSCITDALDRLLADRSVDLVIALGVLASNDISTRGDLPKPAIAPIIIDAGIQSLPQTDGASGVKNLNYVVFPNNVLRDMKAFRELVAFNKVAILVNSNVRDNIPQLTDKTSTALASLAIEPQFVPVGQSVDEALAALDDDIEAVYVAPLFHLPRTEWDRLVQQLIERQLPSFSLFGKIEVERGILACINGDAFPRLSRRVAINFQRIMLGEEAGTLPTAFDAKEQLTINVATARAIGVNPSWGVLTDADLVQDDRQEIERRLTIDRAVKEALEANPELAAKEEEVAAAYQEIKLAESALWPQIDLSLLGVQIDKDLAGIGFQAEREFGGTITLSQILYADPAWANVTIQKRLQTAREKDRDAVRLDIVQAAATAYLDVLRARTFENIQKDNLKKSRDNLELAEVRVSIGTATRVEVLRWESEIANNKILVIDANARRNLAEIQLNRLLNRPSEEKFITEEVEADDPLLLLPEGRLAPYIDNPWSFKLFRRFMVNEGLRSTPEIQALEAAIAAQDRLVAATGRAFWLPQIGLEAGVEKIFDRGGVGADSPVLIDDPTWNVAVFLSYPIFTGASRIYERRQATTTLGQLRLELESTSQIVEQRIRSALHNAGARYADIRQARLAADAADETLALVEESYAQGATSILAVLDAQNNALIANLVAATSLYDFLIEVMEVERSIGKLIIEMSPEDRSAFFERLDAFFAENR